MTDTKQFLSKAITDMEQDKKLISLLNWLHFLEDEFLQRARKLRLVVRGVSFEVEDLKGLGIDLVLAPVLVNIFDTHYLGLEVFGQDFKCSLSRLVRET